MYFCYIDESGDTGAYDTGKPEGERASKYFILSGLIIELNKWSIALGTLKAFRKKLARETPIRYDVEFHCAEMIDPRKIEVFRSVGIKE